MRILVTNDDGIESPGIKALAAALVADGHDGHRVRADDRPERCGCRDRQAVRRGTTAGRARRLARPSRRSRPRRSTHRRRPRCSLRVSERSATKPELVASGINPGQNTGHLVLHSGTVGAALTAAGLDVPGARGEPPVQPRRRLPAGRPRRRSPPPRWTGWRSRGRRHTPCAEHQRAERARSTK